jgi:hypothetical protein
VPLVAFQAVLLQKRPILLLEGHAPMMLFLVGDVLDDLRRSGWADRKSAVPVLPVKVPTRVAARRERRRLRLDLFRRTLFDLLDHLGDGESAGEAT